MDREFWEQGNLVGAGSMGSDWIESMRRSFLSGEDIHSSWKYFFEGYAMGEEADSSVEEKDPFVASEVLLQRKAQLIVEAFRLFGYLQSHVSPLETQKKSPLLQEKLRQIASDDEEIASLGFFKEEKVSTKALIGRLEEIYCGSLAVETASCPPEVQEFVWSLMEGEKDFSEEELLDGYRNICKATLFEEFLQIKFTGQKRFSLEGGEALIPMLEYMLSCGASLPDKITHFVIGMPHRGRLSVLSHVLSKPYRYIFMEFEDNYSIRGVDHVGDVKYHKGYIRNKIKRGENLKVSLLPNPSHLEAVNPVVEGVVAAKQRQASEKDEKSFLAVLLHGDASFAGQGIVYETLQLSKVNGYSTKGSLHIIVNNQIGFTALPRESRSTPYCTDVVKMLGIPVFRVNGDHIPSCLKAIDYALKVRNAFECDVVIDLCCYRKHGHNESDDPSITSPVLYRELASKPLTKDIYNQQLQDLLGKDIEKGLQEIEDEVAGELKREFAIFSNKEKIEQFPNSECKHCEGSLLGDLSKEMDISLGAKTVESLCQKLCLLPEGFHIHKKVKGFLEKRAKMAVGEVGVDWACAEALAFGSLLIEGTPVRLSGQDSARGTFSQRMLLWTDTESVNHYSPLNHLHPDQSHIEVYNSPLSEYAVLGFEYGYAAGFENKALVLWEAQFGDFANGAQIIFDQYISSAIQKWDFHSNLVLLLPHGYEGQGPEHSSARIERYLTLATERNFKVAYPSTPVQYFRLLRQHMKSLAACPLVIFTPKGMLRHPSCVSDIREFSAPSGFKAILEDPSPNYEAKQIVLCSGRIFYDYQEYLLKSGKNKEFACLRAESLYPLDKAGLLSLLKRYPNASQFIWLQEEPINMGAYNYMYMALKEVLPSELKGIGRKESSSTATGSATISKKELEELMDRVFSL